MQPAGMDSPFKSDILAGQVALITGGGSGIGLEISRQLGEGGAHTRQQAVVAMPCFSALSQNGRVEPPSLYQRANRPGPQGCTAPSC